MEGLSWQQQQILLETARKTVEAVAKNDPLPSPPPREGVLAESRGIFVTLHRNDQLRGCIGYIMGVEPLNTAVIRMAKAACSEDPRFPRVKPEELDDLQIEISVLTPLEKVENIEDIEVGEDGLLIKNGFYQGLLLPQVATENNWDREQFLNHTAMKAGLPPSAWNDPLTEIYKFQAQIFS
ncbi:MAG: AmmeMemoRadiSam system protein A [bacterium]